MHWGIVLISLSCGTFEAQITSWLQTALHYSPDMRGGRRSFSEDAPCLSNMDHILSSMVSTLSVQVCIFVSSALGKQASKANIHLKPACKNCPFLPHINTCLTQNNCYLYWKAYMIHMLNSSYSCMAISFDVLAGAWWGWCACLLVRSTSSMWAGTPGESATLYIIIKTWLHVPL